MPSGAGEVTIEHQLSADASLSALLPHVGPAPSREKTTRARIGLELSPVAQQLVAEQVDKHAAACAGDREKNRSHGSVPTLLASSNPRREHDVPSEPSQQNVANVQKSTQIESADRHFRKGQV